MNTEIDALVDVSRETLEETPGRALTFLRALGTHVPIFAAMAGRGYTKKEHEEGWRLVLRASGFVESGPLAVESYNDVAQAAIKSLDSWDEDGMRLTSATLRHRFPSQYEFVMAGLKPSKGVEAVSGVALLLDRLDALENGEDRKATRKADHAALAKLAERGLDADERARLRGLVNAAKSVGAIEKSAPEDAAAREAEYVAALKTLRVWYVEWADVARVAIKRRDRLIHLGLARRKRAKEEDESDEGADADEAPDHT